MIPRPAQLSGLRPMAERLRARGSRSLRDNLTLLRELSSQVNTLHRDGHIHRRICEEQIALDDEWRPQLLFRPTPCAFGGESSEPDFCPPELAVEERIELSAEIEAAAAALARRGLPTDPRRIDVYQLGTLFYRLQIGHSIRHYLYTPAGKTGVPEPAQLLLEQMLGHDPAIRLQDCDSLLAAVDGVLASLPPDPAIAPLSETPPQRSRMAGSAAGTPPRGASSESTCSNAAPLMAVLAADTPAPGQSPVPAPVIGTGKQALPFTRLAHFRILGRIGHGGMGDVYRGYDETLDRPVAIKVLPSELAREEDFVRRFHAEATAAAKIAHPNVVPIYFIGEDQGYHFFAMQLVDGESLTQRLALEVRLAVGAALEVIEQCLAGLNAAHARGMVHRDIKPGNILVDRETNRALLVDFGLVRRLDESRRLTASGMIMGTVDYIAPEQARGQPIDGRADLYAVGVLFYQLLSGRLPFSADTPTAMIFQHAYETPFPLKQAAPDVPSALAAVVSRLMAKDPNERYRDCAEVLADLRAFREGRALAVARPQLSGRPAARPMGRPLPDNREELSCAVNDPACEPPWHRLRDWAATMIRRHSPEFVKSLQNTTQQIDGAVAEYERRRNRISKLLAEARSVANELSERVTENREFARNAKQRGEAAWEKDESLASLERECEVQKRQVEELELQLATADATLARLRSQRDTLQARLRAAQGLQAAERPRSRKVLWLVAAGAVAASIVACVVLTLAWRRASEIVEAVVRAVPGESLSSVQRCSLTGVLFEDKNGNGVQDAGEVPLAGWTIEAQPIGVIQDAPQRSMYSPSGSSQACFGFCISVDGNRLLVGSPRDSGEVGQETGAAYLLDENGRLLQAFGNPAGGKDDNFGWAVALSGDKVLVGSPRRDEAGTDAGIAYVFDATSGELRQTLRNPHPHPSDQFGYSVGFSVAGLLVGAPRAALEGPTPISSGAAYLFDAETGKMRHLFRDPEPGPENHFGESVLAIGNQVIISAHETAWGGVEKSGAVHVFDLASAKLLRTITAPTLQAQEHFGYPLQSAGDKVLVGAITANDTAPASGVVYLADPATGGILKRYANPAPSPQGMFGHRMTYLGGDLVVQSVGSRAGPRASVVYVMDLATGQTAEIFKTPRGNPRRLFGWYLAALGNQLVIGTPDDSTVGFASGAVHIYDLNHRTAVTNSAGRYHFEDLARGTYSIGPIPSPEQNQANVERPVPRKVELIPGSRTREFDLPKSPAEPARAR